MRIILLHILLLTGIVRAQQTAQVERFWINSNTHTAVKNLQFYQIDSLLIKDSSQTQFRILPDIQFAFNGFDNQTSEFKLQNGLTFTLNGNIRDKFSYMLDYRVGTTNQAPVPYNSTFQTKSFFYTNLKTVNPFTAYSIYGDLRGRILYKPNRILTLSVGLDKLFIGEGDRSLFFGNQGIASPFASLVTKFKKFEYHFIQQVWREKEGDHYVPKGNATHFLSFKPTKKWNLALFENVVYQMKDTLYNRGFEVEYLNPLTFYRPQEYNMGSSDNVLLGINLSFTHKNTMLYGQVLLDDFLLSAMLKKTRWWANKFGMQIGVKGWKQIDSTTNLFYRTEINLVRPYTYSQKFSGGVMGNQGLPIAHPLGSNFVELYQEISFHRKKWSFEIWGQAYLKGDDFFTTAKTASYGGDIYQSYNKYVKEFGNTIGQGKTKHIIQLGTYISRKINYEKIFFELIKLPKMLQSNQMSVFIEPKVRFSNVEGEHFTNYFITFGTIKTLGRDRRNY